MSSARGRRAQLDAREAGPPELSRCPEALGRLGRNTEGPETTGQYRAWPGAERWRFKAEGRREVGKGDSVTLIPRLVVELVCCDAEGDWRGHAGRGGSRWHLPATRS